MKKLTTSEGVFGPYQDVEVLPDRYRCDGADLPISVVGQGAISEVQPGDFPDPEPPAAPTQFERDQARYAKRAAAKDGLLAYMAADNMGRVRSGAWTVSELTSLMDDPAVAAANAYMSTLSFELAAQSILAATSHLLTPEIKVVWVGKLQEHFYLEG